MPAMPYALTRPAASSIASAMPSSRRQIFATKGASSALSWNSPKFSVIGEDLVDTKVVALGWAVQREEPKDPFAVAPERLAAGCKKVNPWHFCNDALGQGKWAAGPTAAALWFGFSDLMNYLLWASLFGGVLDNTDVFFRIVGATRQR